MGSILERLLRLRRRARGNRVTLVLFRIGIVLIGLPIFVFGAIVFRPLALLGLIILGSEFEWARRMSEVALVRMRAARARMRTLPTWATILIRASAVAVMIVPVVVGLILFRAG
ncbi:hypothetical protein [Nocardia sp. NPDC056100]|uniref:hypothetical protein n=1 Tax=Nocardia sp. NPDC056100 TaxID=3345712 RepID=UPI0035DA0319